MIRTLLALLALAIVAPIAFAQQLPPPRNPAGDQSASADDLILRRVEQPPVPPQGPALAAPANVPPLPPQNAQQPPVQPPQGAQNVQKNPDPLRDLIIARHKAEKERIQARMDRTNLAQAVRAAEQQKLYQDWHERYLADTPVRVEYYRALTAAYQSQPAIPYYGAPYYYGAGPAVIFPYVYAPVVYTPIYRPLPYGVFVSWGW
jgi:hypothetical protein